MLPAKRKMIHPPVLLCGLALLGLAILMFIMLIPLPQAAEEDVFERHLRNLLHVPLFAVVTFLLRFLQTSWSAKWSSLWVCAMGVFLLGALSEVAQSITGRSCTLHDLIANLSGILLACALLLRISGRRGRLVRLVLLLVGAGMLAFAAQPLAREMLDNRAKRAAFPKILDLDYPNGLWWAQGNTWLTIVERDAGVGGKGLEVQTADGSYEGLRYVVPNGMDELEFSGLLIEIDNPSEVFELGVRLDGKDGQRQYRSVMVPQGRSSLRAEWDSNGQGGGIVRVVLFTGEEQPTRRFLLLDARLIQEFPTTFPADP